MNKGLIFIGGSVIGGIIGFCIGYMKAAKDVNNLFDESYSDNKYIPNEYLRGEESDDNEDTSEERLDRENLESIKEKLTDNWSRTTHYAAAYDMQNDKDDVSEEIDVLEDDPEGIDTETEEYLRKMKSKAPKIISAEAAGELPPGIDQQCLIYWQYDDTVTTEEKEEILDPERFLGNALTEYGFSDNDEKIIFVINYDLGTLYEVQKFERAFSVENM